MSARPHSVRPPPSAAEEAKGYTLAAVPPVAFGKYVLVGKLGHGGMAEVNLAVTGGKGGFRKLFVIKRLHPHLEAEPGFVDMFLDEARLAAQLDHPHCVQTVEVGEVGGQHFLAMEYLDGQGLERLLRILAAHGGSIPPAIAARIALDALDGLGYAHELTGFDGQPLGVVHRDISPQNLFVTYTGVVKLLDFGIAKAASNVVETRTGVIKGKYAYIAPEQALANNIDARADLWSMGVVFWEMLTTRRLFKSVNELATLQETLRGEIPLPSSVNREVPPELDRIVMRALQRDPTQRYPSAAAFKADLEAWLAQQPNAPDRRAISAMMKERFGDIIEVQKQKLRECLHAVAQGEHSLERLIEAGGALSSTEAAALPAPHIPGGVPSGAYTPSGASPLPQHGHYPTPTPYPSQPHASPYPENAYGVPPPTPYPSNPWLPAPQPTAGTLRHEPTLRLQPPPPRETKRSVGWWLVGFGALAVAAVLGAILLRPTGEPEVTAGTTITRVGTSGAGSVVPTIPEAGGAAVEPESVAHAADGVEGLGGAGPTVVGPTVEGEPEDATEPAGSSGSRGSHRRRGGRGSGSSSSTSEPAAGTTGATTGAGAAAGTPTTPEPPAVDPGALDSDGAPGGPGFLTLATAPWTTVSCNGRSLGETPLMRVSLPAGHYQCRLVNSDEGISEAYELDIRSGETTRVRLGLR